MRDFLLLPVRGAQLLHLFVWSAVWITLALLVRLVTGKTITPLNMARWFWAPGLLCSPVWMGPMRIEVEGLDHVDFTKPHFFASNHQSLIDVPVLFRVLPTPLVFVLKEDLRKVPFLGWYVSAMGMIFVRRGERRQSMEALKQGARSIHAGKSVLAFPEGTRSRDGRVGAFKSGVFLPAIDAAIPVVPISIVGTGYCLPPDGFRPRSGTIRVCVGRPIATADFERGDRRRLADQAREQVLALQKNCDSGAATA